MFLLRVNILIVLILIIFQFPVLAQKDSLKNENKIPLLSYILPLSLITVGSALSGSEFEKDLKEDIRNSVGNDYEFKIDDYIQYTPMAELYFFNALGFKARNNWFDMSKNLAIANFASGSLILALKKITDKTRPNGAEYSFPSGHTNFAFTNATVLYHEYKDSNKIVAYSGFAFASTTGVFRMLNNKHWLSDVLTGAGLGILIGNLVYQFEPLKDWHPFGLGEENNIYAFPEFGNDSYGFRVTIYL